MKTPQLNTRQRRHEGTSSQVGPSRRAYSREAEDPWRNRNPQPEKQVQPLLPFVSRDEGGQGDDPDHRSAHPSVPGRNRMLAEAKQPGREHECDGDDSVEPVDGVVFCPMLKGVHGQHSSKAEHQQVSFGRSLEGITFDPHNSCADGSRFLRCSAVDDTPFLPRAPAVLNGITDPARCHCRVKVLSYDLTLAE